MKEKSMAGFKDALNEYYRSKVTLKVSIHRVLTGKKLNKTKEAELRLYLTGLALVNNRVARCLDWWKEEG